MKWEKKLANHLTRIVSLTWARAPKGSQIWTLGLQVKTRNPYIDQLRYEGWSSLSVTLSLCWWALILDSDTRWVKSERVAHVPLTPSCYCDVIVPDGDTLSIRDRALRQYPHLQGVED